MDDQIWVDLGFVTQMARNWADLLVGMKTDVPLGSAADAAAFRTRVHETCDRLQTLLKKADDKARHEHCRTNHVRHPHLPEKWWCCKDGVCFHLGADDG